MSPAQTIRPLSDLLDAVHTGGKAASLSRVIALGHPVPDGFAISDAALTAFVEAHGLSARIAGACSELDLQSPDRIQAASRQIGEIFSAHDLPSDFAADLDAALAPFLPGPLIVRSSAIGEDADDASFAGQLDSIGNVMGAAAVRQALRTVWASKWSARSLTYQLARRKTLPGMGVVIQRQVNAVLSGVLFTTAPTDRRTLLIEYCAGAGDDLVAGRINPGRIEIERATLAWRATATPERSRECEALLVCDTQLRALARRALEIERAAGRPQDIEWTMDETSRIWIVQARPITATASATADDDARRVIWSNANVNENFPQPITPLLYSVARRGYYHYFRNLFLTLGLSRRRVAEMEQPLRHIIGVHGARMYYNLTSIHGLLRSAPFGDLLAAWFNRFVGAEDTDTRAVAPAAHTSSASRIWSRAAQAAEIAAILAKSAWTFAFVTRRVERFERTVAEFAAHTHPDRLRTRGRQDLAADLRGFLDIRCHRWTDASLADTAAMVCYGALERALRRAFPSDDQAALHNSLLKALPGLPSGMPAVKLWELSRLVRADGRLRHLLETQRPEEVLDALRTQPHFHAFARQLDRFLEDWGFRCSGELMLTVKSFQEDPAALFPILRAYVSADGDSPADHLRTQREQRLRDTARVAQALRERRLVRGIPILHQWHAVSRLLAGTQHAILLRERARLKQALLYSRLRRIALALGERLVAEGVIGSADDVFFLTAEEIDDFVSGAEMFPHHVRALVTLRRDAHAAASATTPADTLRLAEGAYVPMSAVRDGRTPATQAGSERDDANHVMAGLGVCGGAVSARAAVLGDITETHKLRRGDVLVTRQTDPGWGAVFPLISGLVMERGGMLSHGAIIAREFGIPSVVGIADATHVIPHGTRIHLDGDLGTVRADEAPSITTLEARAS